MRLMERFFFCHLLYFKSNESEILKLKEKQHINIMPTDV